MVSLWQWRQERSKKQEDKKEQTRDDRCVEICKTLHQRQEQMSRVIYSNSLKWYTDILFVLGYILCVGLYEKQFSP